MIKYIIFFVFYANIVFASIGEVTQSSGSSTIKRDAEKFNGQVGLDLQMQDNIITAKGKLRLDFIDDTRVDVTEHSRMTIDEFIYDPSNGTGTLSMKATLGAVRYASGQIAKNSRQRVNIRTPSATINVRGTDFMMIVDEIGGSMITLLPSCNDAGFCVVGEISVHSDVGTVIMNQAFQTTVVPHRAAVPGPTVVLDIPEKLLSAMLIIRKSDPYTEELLKKVPNTNLLDIDFLKFDELDQDPLVEGIKNIWVTDLETTTYFNEAFYDALEKQLQQIMAQWFDELSVQNMEFFKEKFFGLDPDTGIFYDEVYPNFIVRRKEGVQHFFELRLSQGYGYNIDMEQGGFSEYGYRVGTGGGNNIVIKQRGF
tara:strand:- start:883 stop:1986 length:1104 start_codon:yes stop_codon:yes gene_type:complete